MIVKKNNKVQMIMKYLIKKKKEISLSKKNYKKRNIYIL